MLKIHCLQHVPFETPGSIENWIISKNHSLTSTKFFEDDTLPDLSSFDWLLIMGGPMSVNDGDKFLWLKKEKEFIKSAIDDDKVVIGICLGSQLIANVLGSKVYPNEYKEIGWFPVKTTIYSNDHDLFSALPRAFNVFHWHGETYDLPTDALLLAESDGCKNQLFIWNEKVIGLQFHMEVTEQLIKAMVENGRSELKKNKYIQIEDQILGRGEYIAECKYLMEGFLNNLEDKFSE